ncbi:unnamed protein product [Auanema sp. JU1783]|nr:unnamed protein product [Auanema sp. JU1783]
MEKISDTIIIDEKIRTSDVTTKCSFDALMISQSTVAKMATGGFRLPSPIQEKAIPAGLSGLDLLVQAKSGTGKTLVFSVMAVENLNLQCYTPQRLILAPTREIACQIRDTILKIIPKYGRVVVLVGGNSVADDIQSLKKCHVVVGTTGRVCHLVQQGFLKLNSVDLFVLDEADKLMEDCFEKDINYLFSCLPESRQVAVFSATYPGSLDKMLCQFMKDVTLIRLNSDDVQLVGIKQYVYNTEDDEKKTLLHLCQNISFNQLLVFCNRIADCQTITDLLVENGYEAGCISSQMTQAEREISIQNLKSRKIKILVSSDLTARGVDAEHVNLVINLEPAINVETYLHRIGRAARFGGIGAAISILKDKLAVKQFNKLYKEGNLNVRQLPQDFPSDLISVSKFFDSCQVYKKPTTFPKVIRETSSQPLDGTSYTKEEIMRLRYVNHPLDSCTKELILQARIGTGALSDFKGDLKTLGSALSGGDNIPNEEIAVEAPKKKYTFVPVRAKAKKKFYLRGELLSIRESHSPEVWSAYASKKFDMSESPFVKEKASTPEKSDICSKPVIPAEKVLKKKQTNSQKSNILKYSRKEMINIQSKISKQAWVKYVKEKWDTTQEPFQLDPYLRCPFELQLRRIRMREKNLREKVMNERKKEVNKESNAVVAVSRTCNRIFVTATSFDTMCSEFLEDFHKFSPDIRKGPVVAPRLNRADYNQKVLNDSKWLNTFLETFSYEVRKSSEMCAEVQCGPDEELSESSPSIVEQQRVQVEEVEDVVVENKLHADDSVVEHDFVECERESEFFEENQSEEEAYRINDSVEMLHERSHDASFQSCEHQNAKVPYNHELEQVKPAQVDYHINDLGDILSSYLYLSTRLYS